MDDIYFIILFDSTHYAIQAEDEISKKGFDVRIISAPNEISLGCGFSLKLKKEDVENIKMYILKTNLKYKDIYKVTNYDKKTFEKVSFKD